MSKRSPLEAAAEYTDMRIARTNVNEHRRNTLLLGKLLSDLIERADAIVKEQERLSTLLSPKAEPKAEPRPARTTSLKKPKGKPDVKS